MWKVFTVSLWLKIAGIRCELSDMVDAIEAVRTVKWTICYWCCLFQLSMEVDIIGSRFWQFALHTYTSTSPHTHYHKYLVVGKTVAFLCNLLKTHCTMYLCLMLEWCAHNLCSLPQMPKWILTQSHTYTQQAQWHNTFSGNEAEKCCCDKRFKLLSKHALRLEALFPKANDQKTKTNCR